MAKPFLAVISIVDDDVSVAEATGSLLRANGFTVATFVSAAQFLASSERNQTVLLILDVCMPGMGGLELYRQLKRDQRAIPTLFITGHGTEEDRAAALAEGALGYLSKPFTEAALLAVIRQVIRA
jgi:FixJ family two-component response regulator